MSYNGLVVDLTDESPVDLSSHHNSSGAGPLALSTNHSSAGSGPISLTTNHVSAGAGPISLTNNHSTGALTPFSMSTNHVSAMDVDDSPDKENLFVIGGSLTPQEAVKLLREELRNEETKLLLLKKIKLSQSSKTKSTATVPPTVRTTNGTSQQPVQQQQQVRGGTPSVRGELRIDASPQTPTQLPSKCIIKSPQYNSGSSSRGIRSGGTNGVGATNSTASPVVRNDAATAASIQQQRALAQQQQLQKAAAEAQRQQQIAQQQQLAQQQQQQLAQQRQASAKQALRKQLEQTLLQIPPPKPPPPTVTLIPNANSAEFLILVGLEECVQAAEKSKKKVTDGASTGEKVDENGESSTECDVVREKTKLENAGDEVKACKMPRMCRQCCTDHTPVWVDVKDSAGAVVCEKCDSSNRKQALKLEHTNRLKSAFVKALQQEQAIDQGMGMTGGHSGGSPGGTPTGEARASPRPAILGSASRGGGTIGPEELARRMIAQRNSATGQQYRPSTNQVARPAVNQSPSNQVIRNSPYDRPSPNQTSRAPANQIERFPQVRYEGQGQGQSGQRSYKVVGSDEGRFGSLTNRGSPYNRN